MFDQSEKEKVIAKIRKLFAMSESTSLNEASIAAEKAQALMSEYGISAGDFMAKLEIPTSRNVPLWQQNIACTIEKLYGVVLRRNTTCVYEDYDEDEDYDFSIYEYSLDFIGDEIYATVAYEMFIYLRDTIIRLSSGVRGRRAKDSFCKGAGHAVAEKLKNMGTDAAWIDQRDKCRQQACNYVENTLCLTVPKTTTVHNNTDPFSYSNGRDAGNSISLNRQASGIGKQGRITGY
ncbi:MAG: hypothetical protein Ta2B_10200 [Termitinemataceae bacterium]|nr:MAG: hypothetical protein Ta2B_10200 [Termitinemataceae bacterium]